MVAIVSGARLGLELGSLATLGAAAQPGNAMEGRNGQGVYVDVTNGNVVVQQQDDLAIERGADLETLRTYNSQGTFDDDNGDNWRNGGETVRLSGTVNAVGSSMQRVGRDGSIASYAYDVVRALYVSTDGAGAYDTVRYVAAEAQFEWRDGDTGLVQRYEGTGAGRLLLSRSSDGNTLTYAYSVALPGLPSQLSSVTAGNGDATYYDYVGGNLSQVRMAIGGSTTTRVHYGYDTSNRLSSVAVDLSPADGSTADGNTYVTTYAYDGASKRIARITQTDGSSLAFTYVDAGNGVFMVSSITNALNQVTRYNYGLSAPGAASYAVVTDPLGTNTRFDFDARGQVTAITAPAVNGVASVRQFTYTANGDIASVADGEGRTTVFQYDANGNQVLQRDAAGNTVTRTFDARNQLLSETRYVTPDPDGAGPAQPAGALTTRYVYDAAGRNQLRFVVTAEGRVTEHRYDAYGQRTSTIVYAGATDAAAVAAASAPTEADLVAWTAQVPLTANQRVDMVYDPRGQGQLMMRTTYASVTPAGDGIADATASTERFLYDPAGLLLQSFSPAGAVTSYTYDGMRRVTLTVDALGQSTSTRYSDSGAQTIVQHANGLLTTSSYDLAGRLVSVVESPGTAPATTRYFYDAAGRLRMTQDPTGVRTWKLYDEDGRLAADIDGTGTLTEYSYDRSDRVVRTMAWGTAVNTTLLVDASGAPVTTATVAALRPGASGSDAGTWNQYDAAGRLARQARSVGTALQAAVTETRYDGASRVVQVLQYANTVPADGSAGGVAPGNVPLPPPSAQDRLTRSFYDGEGRLTGTLDAEGFLTTYGYNAAGLLASTLAYATAVAPALRSAATLAQLLPAASANDIAQTRLYDGKGHVIAQVDGENYLTESVYDADGNLARTVRYANRVAVVSQSVASMRPFPSPNDRVTTRSYDALDRLAQETDPEGVVTQYAYDNMGNLVSTVRAAGTAEARSLLARYDLQGRLTGELSPVGAALLTGGQTQAQVDAIWAQYATTYTYDAAGRRTSARDPVGNTTWFWYDADGALRYTVNALGEVRERRYDARGRLIQEIAYATRGPAAGPGGVLTVPLAIAAMPAQDSVTTYTYTRDDEVATSTDAEGNVFTRGYNVFGDEVTRADAIGPGLSLVQNFTVDHRGQRTAAASDPAGINAVTATTFDAFGRPTRTVDANGNVRDQTYDRLGRLIVQRDPTSAVRTTSYDAFGRQLVQTDALGNKTTYAYDNATRTTIVTTPEGVRTTTTRNRHGQVQSISDGNGQVTTFAYDAGGRLLRTTTPAGTSTASAYDAAGRLTETADANGNRVVYGYDAANRVLTRRLDPAGLNLTTTYQYDGKGQQVAVTDPNGVTTSYAYDRNGRVLVQTVDPGGLNLATSYRYDPAGHVLAVTTPGGATTQYTFDVLGRRTQETRLVAGVPVTRSWTYDRNGNAVTSSDALGAITRYAYDADDRLVFTVDPAGDVRQLAYDAEGRVTRRVDYATPISTAGWSNAVTPADVQARVVARPAQDEAESSVYDRDGRRTFTVDGTGGVVGYVYDGDGNVVSRTAYANRVSGWSPGMLLAPVPDAVHDERQQTVYDALNRAVFTMDGVGAVVAQRYDGNGNVVERIAYAAKVPTATVMTQSAVASAVALVANPERDLDVRNTYDAANRLTWSVGGTGAVTRRVYDRAGNVVQQVAFAAPIPRSAAASSVPASGSDRIVSRAYDSANRMVFEIDPLNTVTQRVFDADGRVTGSTVYANALATVPALGQAGTVAAIRSALRPAAADRTTYHGYDAVGHEIATIAADRSFVETSFDAAGRMTARIAHANTVTAAVPVNATGDQLRTLVAPSTADRRTSYAYDAAGRLISQIDPLGAATQTQYDGIGRVVSVLGPAAHVQTTQYDAAGRRIAATDALGQVESFAYDGAGRELTFTNKKRAVWTYDHDAAGRTIREVSPNVALTSTALVNGTVSATGTLPSAAVVTLTTYDALGNVTQRTEAAGRAGEERTTRYEYDAAGRQVHVLFAQVAVYDAASDKLTVNGATGLAGRVETNRTLQTRTYYDALGNAVANRDVGGALSQKVYDRAGRVAYEIDPLGYVTGYTRNAFGDATALTRFAGSTSLALRSVNQAGQAATSAEVSAALAAASHAADRTVLSAYDAMGRVIEKRDPKAFVYDSLRDTGFDAAAVTRTVYDVFGEVQQVSTARDDAGVSWFTTTHYWDAGGRETATVSAMGDLTTRAYDAVGNLTRVTEYSTALSPGSWGPGVFVVPEWQLDDRTVTYTYDTLDRKTSETRVNVAYSTNASGSVVRGDLATRYGYDALGNQTSVQDALGNVTFTCYDALGRVSAVLKPAGSASDRGAAVTEYRRDANGNVVLQIDHAVASTAAPPASGDYLPVPEDLQNDHRTLTHFDVLGRALESTDANGATAYASFDAYGHVAKRWQAVTGSDGLTRTAFQANVYDALGQLVETRTPASTTVVRAGVNASYAAGTSPFPGSSGVLTTPNKVTLGWSTLIDPAGGAVRVEVDYVSSATQVMDVDGNWVAGAPSQMLSVTQDFTAAAAAGGAEITWSVRTDAVTAIRVSQNVAGAWVSRWQGSLATANGSGMATLTQDQAGLVYTDQEFNAFGELTRRGTQGGRQEYFDYDAAGRLWRTNSGDGVDVARLYDLQGNVTSEIRSAGMGGGNVDVRAFDSARTAAANPNTRREDIQYDARGHVTARIEPARAESEGGASVLRSFVSASVQSAIAMPPTDAYPWWSWAGQNTVRLSWNNLSALGSGDLKVTLQYRTPLIKHGGETNPETGAPMPVTYTGGTTRTYESAVLVGDANATSATLAWKETAANADTGGVGEITWIQVQKKNLNGDWVTVINQDPGYGANEIDVAAPADTYGTALRLDIRPAGSTQAWMAQPVVNFGNTYRFDASGLGIGSYEYRVMVTPPGQPEKAVDTGTVTLSRPPLNAIGTTISYGQAAAGVLAWQAPASGTQQVLHYRVAGTSSGWSDLAVSTWNAGLLGGTLMMSGVNTASLAGGTYEFELLWSAAGQGVPTAHATGTFTVVPKVPAYYVPASGLPAITGVRIGSVMQPGTLGATTYAVLWDDCSADVAQYRVPGGSWMSLAIMTSPRYGVDIDAYYANTQGASLKSIPPGTYELQIVTHFGVVSQATATLVVSGSAPPTLTITTPPYVPGRWVAEVPARYSASINTLPGTSAISTTEGAVASQSAGLNGYGISTRPKVLQQSDRWGNVLQVTDPRNANWVTNYRYNANNQLIYRGQGPYGDLYTPFSETFYDALGRQVATRDPLGHVNGQAFDGAGHLVQEQHADGGAVTYRYDMFGRKSQVVDANGNLSVYTYDKLDHLLSVDKGAVRVFTTASITNQVVDLGMRHVTESWTYDQLGQKTSYINGNGEKLTYRYDLRGNIELTTQPMQQQTWDAFDAQGRKIGEVDANRYASYWTYDYFGQLTDHTDLGGARYAYSYDNARQLLLQTNTRGQRLEYTYDAAGQVLTTTDRADNKLTTYAYDAAGRHVRERVTQNGITYQDNHLGYDAFGNLRDVADGRVHVSMNYDKAGNRSFIGTTVDYQGVSADTRSSSYRYFQYDAMNRQSVVDAVDSLGNIGQQGHVLTYDRNGNRIGDTYWGQRVVSTDSTQALVGFNEEFGAIYAHATAPYSSSQGYVREQYHYDALNRLLDVERDGTQVDLRFYDGADRVIRSGANAVPNGYMAAWNSGGAASQASAPQIRINRYDANGRMLHQRLQNIDQTEKADISWDPTEVMGGRAAFVAGGYDGVGNAISYTVQDAASGALTKYTTTLRRFDAHQAETTTATSTVTGAGSSTQAYDANGFLTGYSDSAQHANDRNFVNDASGRALYVEQGGRIQRQLIANGEVLGTYGVGVDPVTPNVEGNPNFANLADFNFSYAPISARYPSASPGAYLVHPGDTLQAIAKSAYGDSDLWFRIAEANGLAGNNDLKVGQTLNIPNAVTTVHNNDGTFKPYDPSRITGDMTPTLPMPGNEDGCGGVGKLLMVVVAVVVTIYTAGVLSEGMPMLESAAAAEYETVSFGDIMGLGANSLASGAISLPAAMTAGAAGSIAGQAVGLATGATQRFSWTEVALSAISAGVGSRLGPDVFGDDLPGRMVRSAVANGMTQGVAVVTGLQQRFDWRAVAASAAGTSAGDLVSAGIQNSSDLLRRAISGLAAGTVTAIAHGGRVDVQQVAVDAFGNALAESLAGPTTGTPVGAAYRNDAGSNADGLGEAWDLDVAERRLSNDPIGIRAMAGDTASVIRRASILLAPVPTTDAVLSDSSRDVDVQAWLMRNAGYDGGVVATAGVSVRVAPGTGARSATVNGVSVDLRADAKFQAAGDLLGVGDLYRDYRLLGSLMSELQQATTIDRLKRALQARLGMMRVVPSPEALGAIAEIGGGGVVRYNSADLIDRYADALRKTEMWKQGLIELDTHSMLITSIGNRRMSPARWVEANTNLYLAAFAAGVEEGRQRFSEGKLPFPADMPEPLQVGIYGHQQAERAVVRFNYALGLPEGAGQLIAMNRWSYDPSGSGMTIRPDMLLDLGPNRPGQVLRFVVDGKSSMGEALASHAQFTRASSWLGTPAVQAATPEGLWPWTPVKRR